jgi:two-component system chemotaxis response regulator CheB
MGQDGAQGMLKLRGHGARTFAQDESTSVVYGMPKVAAEIGAAEKILALQEIGPAILKALRERKRIRAA